jgi:diguanylate cyclase (GGDEF)-like protein/PAS domain S-box-containing protein
MRPNSAARRRSLDSLRNNEEKLRILFHNTDEGICCLDSAGACTYANPACLRMLGYTDPDQLLGKNIHEITRHTFTDGDAMSFHDCCVSKTLREGKGTHRDDEMFLRADGTVLHVEYNSFPEIVDGRVRGAIVTFVDNSKHRKAEEELKESQKRFRGLVETLYDWIWEIDTQGCYTYVSPQIKNILGYEPHEILGKTPFDLMSPGEGNKLSERIVDLIKVRLPIVSLENANMHKDGSIVILETNGLPFFDKHGNYGGYRGVDRDITKRKQAEEKLRRNEEALREAQRIAKLGNWEFDFEKNELTWDESLFELLEINPMETAPSYEGFINMVHFEDRPMVDKAHYDSVNKLDPSEISCRLLMKDGRIKWINQVFRAERDEQGHLVKLFGIVQDISELKDAMEKIRHMANHDFLTELPTMRLARDRLAMAIRGANRYSSKLAVMFIDLDGFKEVNDRFGHDVGDFVLKHVANRLISGVRATNTVARVGGDEFLMIATDIDIAENAGVVAEKSLRRLSEPIKLDHTAGKNISVSASIGIAIYPDNGTEINSLIKAADEAMYRVKNAGKNGYAFAPPHESDATPG